MRPQTHIADRIGRLLHPVAGGPGTILAQVWEKPEVDGREACSWLPKMLSPSDLQEAADGYCLPV